VMCQADLYQSIFWLRNPPVMVRPPWLNWSLGDFEKNEEWGERGWMGLMGDARWRAGLPEMESESVGVRTSIEVTPQKRIQIPRLVHDVIDLIDV
jgi:hypothetical protein